ncbi:Amine sulfotransferase [Holothuria leucospilota]|uniref:Amine sulfotransferase n=1 Tax=Holothuria leucospilota TaxID=206669 RepID=A0A9Q0YJN2_HOLLE|nr:Amine sulfotransferase [Holothuria leucospilota]
MDRNKMANFEQLVIFNKNGFPLPANTNEDFMKELYDMEVREDDIFVVTYSKSGAHWMQEIVHLILNEGHVEKLNASHRQIVIEVANCRSFTPETVSASGPVLRKVKSMPSPRVVTTHVPYSLLPKQLQENPCKLIYIYRHPKDVIVSNYHFSSRILEMCTGERVLHSAEQFANFFDLSFAAKFQYGSWFDHVNEYYKHKDDESFLSISFEAMKMDLPTVERKIASFIGRQLDDAAVCRVVEGASFESMQTSFKRDQAKNKALGENVVDTEIFVNKGEMRQWKHYFTAEQNHRFDQLFSEKMQHCHWTKPYALHCSNESSTS